MILQLNKFNDARACIPYLNVSGVYAFIYNNEVIYVGQSKNVGDRIKHHYSTDVCIRKIEKEMLKDTKGIYREAREFRINFYKFLKENINDINFIVLPVEIGKLNQEEELYINKYKPKYNWAGVKDKYTPVNR